MENTSGQGKASVLPAELKGWNWGAFFLHVIWGIGNDTYIALLTLIPPLFVVMPFVLGAKGNEWAWRNRRWDDVAHFKRVQRNWAKWGAIFAVGFFVLFGALFFSILYFMSKSDAYRFAVSRLQTNSEAIQLLGQPIKTGFAFGSISTDGDKGKADLNFSAEGPKSKGTVYVEGIKESGQWNFNRLELVPENQGHRINLR